MKWLKMEKKEARSNSLTVRLSDSSFTKMERLISYLEKKYGKVSQADLIEQLLDVAYKEFQDAKGG